MSPRRARFVLPPGLFAEPKRPAPTYPEYEQLLADAKAAVAADHGRVDPVKLYRVQNLRRGSDWNVAVLGYYGTGTATLEEMNMLLLADERNLNPRPPQWLVEQRAADAKADEQRRAERRHRDDLDQQEWEKVLGEVSVELVVRRNGTARVRYGYRHNLGHAVPTKDVFSGTASKLRVHRAGRGLCETENRRELDLSGGDDGPATCTRCLSWAVRVRATA